jgi:hypothetical protein
MYMWVVNLDSMAVARLAAEVLIQECMVAVPQILELVARRLQIELLSLAAAAAAVVQDLLGQPTQVVLVVELQVVLAQVVAALLWAAVELLRPVVQRVMIVLDVVRVVLPEL